MPKLASGSGSMTEWITCCRCDVSAPIAPPQFTVNLCKICGKRKDSGRAGSFTQFIFRFDLCSCNRPDFVPVAHDVPQNPDSQQTQVDEFAGIEIDKTLNLTTDDFPLNRYQPLQRIGAGGFGSVYLCRDLVLNKRVVVKTLHAHSNEQLLSFQNEARALSKFDHPNIVRILDFGTIEGRSPYMVLQHSPGISLKEELDEREFLDADTARLVFTQLAEALSYCHERQVLHRDLKPQNILFCQDELGNHVAKLIDFGIAIVEDQERTSVNGRTIAGTPAYMAPDQVRGYKYDARSEIYSFGCVLFEALTGRPPFIGETSLDVLTKHANEEPPAIEDFVDDAPEPLQEIVERCLKKQPSQRFQNMNEVLAALSPNSAHAVLLTESSNGSMEVEGTKSRKGVILAATICGIVAIGAGIGFMTLPKDSIDSQKPTQKDTSNYPTSALDPGLSSNLQQKYHFEKRSEGNSYYSAFGHIDKEAIRDLLKNYKPVGIFFEAEGLKMDFNDLLLLKDHKPLRAISLSDTRVGDRECELLVQIPQLNHISLSNTLVTDKGISKLGALKGLNYLSLATTNITGDCLKDLKHLPIRTLRMEYCENLRVKNLDVLTEFTSLVYLNLNSVHFGDAGLQYLSKTKVEALEVNDTAITDKGIAFLTKLPLKKLSVGDNPGVTDACIPDILKMQSLQSVHFGMRAKVTDEGEKLLARARPNLKVKHTRGWVGEDSSKAAAGLNDLQVLDPMYFAKEDPTAPGTSGGAFKVLKINSYQGKISGKLGSAEIDELAKQTWLTSLVIAAGTDVTWEALPNLNKTNVNELDLQFVRPTDAAVQYISQLAKVQLLNLSHSRITTGGVKLIQGMPSLNALRLSHTKLQGVDVAPILSSMPRLRSLSLENINSLTAADIEQFGRLTNLHLLNVASNPLDDNCLKALGRLHVQVLDVSDCGLTDESLQTIAENKSLKRLSIAQNGGITDKALQYLCSLPKLKVVKIGGIDGISRRAQLELMNQLPKLKFVEARGFHNVGMSTEEMMESTRDWDLN